MFEVRPLQSVEAPEPIFDTSLAAVAAQSQRLIRRRSPASSQLDTYLDGKATEDTDPLAFWKRWQSEMPGLAQMAKDVLAVPVSGVGVERLFNTA